MRNYRINAATMVRIIFGVELGAGLRLFPETAPLADGFEKHNDQLAEVHDQRQAARKPMVKARVGQRLAAYQARQVIKSAAKAAEIADGGRRGPIFEAVFPEGTRSVANRKGKAQMGPTKEIVDRVTKCKVPGIDAYRNEWLPKLTGALTGMQKAAFVLETAVDAYDDAFATEVALRDQHRVEVDRIIGQVRAAFPGDTTKQDLVFPEPDAEDDAQTAKKDAKPAKKNAAKPAKKSAAKPAEKSDVPSGTAQPAAPEETAPATIPQPPAQ
ncbi:MAG: hypothetical protein QM820_25820 [Minicystis sp.]